MPTMLKYDAHPFDAITIGFTGTVERMSFDAWGWRRNATGCTNNNLPTYFGSDREDVVSCFIGQNGDAFRWKNMLSEAKSREQSDTGNGRVYDPCQGRFLSPDVHVQSPDFTQDYNRYSYVLNNPLKYTDPSGWIKNPGFRADVWQILLRLWYITPNNDEVTYTFNGDGSISSNSGDSRIIIQYSSFKFFGNVLSFLGIGKNVGNYQRIIIPGTEIGWWNEIKKNYSLAPVIYVEIWDKPKNFDKIIYKTELEKYLVNNGFNPNIMVVYKYGVNDFILDLLHPNRPTKTVVIRKKNSFDREEDAAVNVYDELHPKRNYEITIYSEMFENKNTYWIVQSIMHEIGHMFGFPDVKYGEKGPIDVMNYNYVWILYGIGFTLDRIKIIEKSIWGR